MTRLKYSIYVSAMSKFDESLIPMKELKVVNDSLCTSNTRMPDINNDGGRTKE
jgi:hypothetical protein